MRERTKSGKARSGVPAVVDDCGCEPPDRGRSVHSRRSVLTKGAAGAAAAWATPLLLSRPASAGQGSPLCVPQLLDWDLFSIGSVFTSTTVGGVTITLTVVPLPSTDLTLNNTTVVASPSGGIPEQAILFQQQSDALGVGQTVTFSFSSPVSNVGFTITDIDNSNGQWADRLVMQTAGYGFSFAGTTLMTGDGTVATPFLNSNPNLNLPHTDDRGNVTITYAGPISSFTFEYFNGVATNGVQQIRLTDIAFEDC